MIYIWGGYSYGKSLIMWFPLWRHLFWPPYKAFISFSSVHKIYLNSNHQTYWTFTFDRSSKTITSDFGRHKLFASSYLLSCSKKKKKTYCLAFFLVQLLTHPSIPPFTACDSCDILQQHYLLKCPTNNQYKTSRVTRQVTNKPKIVYDMNNLWSVCCVL